MFELFNKISKKKNSYKLLEKTVQTLKEVRKVSGQVYDNSN